MRIERVGNGLLHSPHEGVANHAFVILGRSSREAACADPRIHAVTFPLRSDAVNLSLIHI